MIVDISSALALVAPLPLLLVGLLVRTRADSHIRRVKTFSNRATWFALICAVAATTLFVTTPQQSYAYLTINLPGGLGAFAVKTLVDPLTFIMLLLVSFMGMIVSRFSVSYMQGDPHEGRFHKWLSLTVGVFLLLIVSDNIWEFWLLFVLASLSLHQLLIFYRERPAAVVAARKKYLLSRIADISLFVSFLLIARTTGKVGFSGIARWAYAQNGSLPVTLQVAAGLVVLTAILKSGVFPLHGWLIQVMEAPTQVSALLHAGLIYTGAFLLLRVSPLITHVSWTWIVLVIVGLLSVTMAALMMMAETNIKESLAYSTSAQLGFMLMECGLGLYSIAVLHIVAHSVYKAHAFLSSGSVVDNYRGPMIQKLKIKQSLGRAELAIVVSGLVTFGVALMFGIDLQGQPTLLTIGAIVAIAMSQLLLQGLNRSGLGAGALLFRAGVLSVIVVTAYFGLHDLSSYVLGTSVPSDTAQADHISIWLLALIVVAFVSLLHIQQLMPRLQRSRFGQAMYMSIYNGMYVDLVLSQLTKLDANKTRKRIDMDTPNSHTQLAKRSAR